MPMPDAMTAALQRAAAQEAYTEEGEIFMINLAFMTAWHEYALKSNHFCFAHISAYYRHRHLHG